MMKNKLIFLIAVLFIAYKGGAQDAKYEVRTVAFYNVENLFDTINDPKTFDDDRTPSGADRWTSDVYNSHLSNIAKVISEVGKDMRHRAPDIIGLAEVENRGVLEDLLNTPYLKNANYGIAHFDSPDRRGIDVALLYNKNVFIPENISKHTLKIYDGEKRIYTRDQLLVQGRLDDEEMYFIVNHWPSRRGGESASRRFREAAAALNRKIIDSIQQINPKVRIVGMGDFNDDPINSSFKKVLKTKRKKATATAADLYNPMEDMYRRGMGTLAYRDSWSLFDQIYFTGVLLKDEKKSYRFWKAGVFNKEYLINQAGRYKGYPMRSMANGNYTGGYSDHFPVYIYLVRRVER